MTKGELPNVQPRLHLPPLDMRAIIHHPLFIIITATLSRKDTNHSIHVISTYIFQCIHKPVSFDLHFLLICKAARRYGNLGSDVSITSDLSPYLLLVNPPAVWKLMKTQECYLLVRLLSIPWLEGFGSHV